MRLRPPVTAASVSKVAPLVYPAYDIRLRLCSHYFPATCFSEQYLSSMKTTTFSTRAAQDDEAPTHGARHLDMLETSTTPELQNPNWIQLLRVRPPFHIQYYRELSFKA